MATRSLLTKNFAPIAPDNTAPSSHSNNASSEQESLQISVAPYDVLDRILWDDDEQFMRVRGRSTAIAFVPTSVLSYPILFLIVSLVMFCTIPLYALKLIRS